MKKRSLSAVITAFIIAVFSISILLYAGDKPPEVKLPGFAVKSIQFNRDLDMYEVVGNNMVFFLSKYGRYAFIGDILDTKTMKNITEERKRELLRVDFSKLPLEYAVRIGEGKRRIAVFSSPFCPWCRKLHEEFRKMKDVSVYVFVSPFGDRDTLRSIMCSRELFDLAYEGKKIEKKVTCEASANLDRIQPVMSEFGISAFPTMILENGRMIAGFVTADRIEKEMAR